MAFDAALVEGLFEPAPPSPVRALKNPGQQKQTMEITKTCVYPRLMKLTLLGSLLIAVDIMGPDTNLQRISMNVWLVYKTFASDKKIRP